MRSERIKYAYDRIAPAPEVKETIKARIMEKAACEGVQRKRPVRRVVLIAACIVLALSLCGVGYGAYQKWSLPKPEAYEPTGSGVLDVHSEEQYAKDTIAQAPEAEPLTDEAFIRQAVALLQSLGLNDVDTETMTISRQENLLYGREEAAVLFERADIRTEITYNADTGGLLSVSSIDYLDDAAQPVCQSEAEAQALAEEFYAILPVRQGYTLIGHTEYDEQYYSYEFCHKLPDGLINEYEMVRIGVNPYTGRLCGCNVFDFPLLDDHAPEDVPQTQAQAEEIAQSIGKVDSSLYTLTSAEVKAVLPNWMFTGAEIGNYRFSEVSRIGWVLTYENPDSECADIIRIDIDYYTGEILGGDMT